MAIVTHACQQLEVRLLPSRSQWKTLQLWKKISCKKEHSGAGFRLLVVWILWNVINKMIYLEIRKISLVFTCLIPSIKIFMEKSKLVREYLFRELVNLFFGSECYCSENSRKCYYFPVILIFKLIILSYYMFGVFENCLNPKFRLRGRTSKKNLLIDLYRKVLVVQKLQNILIKWYIWKLELKSISYYRLNFFIL